MLPAGEARGVAVIAAIQTWHLHLEGCQSLKDKRSIIQSLKAWLRRTHNCSVAETGDQDLWQRAALSCAVVGSDRTTVEETLRAVDRMVEETDGARIIETVVTWR
jgi:uncharacterized protein YlxP (DUF503 family)